MYRDKSCIFLLLFLDPQKKKGLVCYNLPLQSYRISAPWFCGLSNLEHGLQLELPQLSSSVMLMVWIRESESELHSTWCCLLDQSAKDRERLISGLSDSSFEGPCLWDWSSRDNERSIMAWGGLILSWASVSLQSFFNWGSC